MDESQRSCDDEGKLARRRILLRRKLCFSAITMLLAFIVLESLARVVLFQFSGNRPLASWTLIDQLSAKVQTREAAEKRKQAKESLARELNLPLVFGTEGAFDIQWGAFHQHAWERLFGSEGSELLEEFKARYRKHFERLVHACRQANSKLTILYIPQSHPDSWQIVAEAPCRAFYRQLAGQYELGFVDTTEAVREHQWADVTLMPDDRHFSRFGNRVVATVLAQQLPQYNEHHSAAKSYEGTPPVCGDLVPNCNEVQEFRPGIATLLVTNRQGFRMDEDLAIPERRQRVLLLGDSFTFGPGLPNKHTYPGMLARLCPGLEIVNAGVCGYTINDETDLFEEKARHIAPDITVLQVLDNDLYGFFYYFQNRFARSKSLCQPSRGEARFLAQVMKAQPTTRVAQLPNSDSSR